MPKTTHVVDKFFSQFYVVYVHLLYIATICGRMSQDPSFVDYTNALEKQNIVITQPFTNYQVRITKSAVSKICQHGNLQSFWKK